MKITQVGKQKKNTNRYNIYLDGQFAFGADEDLVVNRRLVVGQEINKEDLSGILLEAEAGKIMERIYRLFNIRQRSEKEIWDYLKNLSFKRKIKGADEISLIICTTIVEQLKKKGLINDLEFAKLWVESRSKKYGVNRIKQELVQKGIDREIVEEVISSEFIVNNEEKVIEELLDKKINRWKNLPSLELRKKAIEFLVRKGFQYSVVKDIVDNYVKKE